MLKGGCYCGAIRYEAEEAPFQETICHCSICRRTTGAPMVAWFSVPLGRFRFVQGAPTRFRSSAEATRTFCARCGTQLTFQRHKSADVLDLTTCSLDAPEAVPPHDHIWTASQLAWVKVADGLPRYQKTPIDD